MIIIFIFQKEKTFLKQFDKTTKLGYDKIGSKKYLFWFCILLICLALQFAGQFFSVLLMSAIMFLLHIFRIVIAVIQGREAFLYDYLGNLNSPLNNTYLLFANLAIGTGSIILIFLFYIKFIEKRPFKSIGLTGPNNIKKYLSGALIAVIMQVSYFAIVLIFGWAEILSKPVHASKGLGFSAFGYILLFLVGFVIQGASEEVVLRGWMLPVLSRHYKVTTSIIISSIVFGLLHALNPNVTILSILNICLYGIFACLYALNDGGLWGIFAQHSIWNWFMGNILGMPVSGMIIGKVSIIETKLTGPSWITGGEFGPEGGILTTLIFSIAIIIVIKQLIKKEILVNN